MVDHDTLSDNTSEASPVKRAALGLAVSFVVVEGLIRGFELYRRLPWVDVPSHLLSGAAVTALLLLYLNHRGVRRRVRWALLGNVVVALAWELAETVDEIVSPDPAHLQDVFVWDGVGDITAALVGGSIVLWALRNKQSGHEGSQPLPAGAHQQSKGEHGK